MLLAGGGLGNAVLFSIGKALRAAGSRVIYFAGYRKGEDLFKRDEIEAAADQVVWSLRHRRRPSTPRRPQDRPSSATSCRRCWPTREGELGEQPVALADVRPHHRHRLATA